jgi:hypothetical protein
VIRKDALDYWVTPVKFWVVDAVCGSEPKRTVDEERHPRRQTFSIVDFSAFITSTDRHRTKGRAPSETGLPLLISRKFRSMRPHLTLPFRAALAMPYYQHGTKNTPSRTPA